MKTVLPQASRRPMAFSLLECLAYLAVSFIVLGVALVAFHQTWTYNKKLRHNAEDIVRAPHAGEQWRADVRAATGPVRVTTQPTGERCLIPAGAATIRYDFNPAEGTLERRMGAATRTVLTHVKTSHMLAEPRTRVTAWRWELELEPTQKKVALQPLFTFETVGPPLPAP
jgi:Tfp pilus assembly protein FimT